MTRRKSAILAIALSLGLVLGACGDDTSPSADDQAESGDEGETSEGAFTVKLSADGLEVPAEISAGVVEVTVETDLEDGEVNFTKAKAGTSEEDFRAAIASATTGGPIPDVLEATVGLHGTQHVQIPEGDLFVWADPPRPDEVPDSGEGEGAEPEDAPGTTAAAGETARGQEEEEGGGEEEQGPDPSSFFVETVKASGDAGGEIPDTGSITARDYSFDVKVRAGEEKFYFTNEGPNQVHHVVLFNFGKIPVDDVEENLVPFLESEGEGPQPEAFKDLDMSKFDAGSAGVTTPGLGATGDGKFESGNTYAAVCFIQDRTGGPPHAFAKGMRTVFSVE